MTADQDTVPRRPPRYLSKCAAIALWGFSLIFFLMQLPWIAVKMNPGGLEAGMESLKTQTMITFSPLFLALGAMITALFFSAVQNKFIASVALGRGKTVGKSELRRLFFPFARQIMIRELLGDEPLLKASGWCILLFWVLYAVLGLLSPLPPWFLLAGILLFFAAAKKFAVEKIGPLLRLWAMALTVVFCLSSIDGIAALNDKNKVLPAAEIPQSRQALKELLYQGKTTDPVYSRLAEAANLPENRKFISPLLEAQFLYTAPAPWREQAAGALNKKELHDFFKPLTEALDSGKTIRPDLHLDAPYIWHPGGDWFFSRIAATYYASCVFNAIDKKDRVLMLKYFRRLDTLYSNVQQGDFIISLSYIFLNELNRSCTIGAMLGSGLLTAADIAELKALNRNREKHFRSALLTALQGEACFERELMADMARVYPWMQSGAASKSGKLEENAVLKFFLRGSLPVPPLVWNAVMNQRAAETSSRKFNHLLKTLRETPSYPQWKEKLTELEKDLSANGSYFVMLNYNATRTAVAQLFHAITCVRLTDLALEIARFRMDKGRLPRDLKELNIPLPVDAVSGKALGYDGKKIEIILHRKEKDEILTLPGWQLSGTEKEHIKLCVPGIWPIPAPQVKTTADTAAKR